MAGHPLRPATRQRLGGPSPRQQADRTRPHPMPQKAFPTPPCGGAEHPVLPPVSRSYSGAQGRLVTHYSPVRHSHPDSQAARDPVRLACVKHAASVHPEPESNPPQKTLQKAKNDSQIHFKRNQTDHPIRKDGHTKTSAIHQNPTGLPTRNHAGGQRNWHHKRRPSTATATTAATTSTLVK